ncbi:unnamed protein product [Ectocarpus fasciculatus]
MNIHTSCAGYAKCCWLVVVVFAARSRALNTGRGRAEKNTPLKINPTRPIVTVAPDLTHKLNAKHACIHLSTPPTTLVYAGTGQQSTETHPDIFDEISRGGSSAIDKKHSHKERQSDNSSNCLDTTSDRK